jgi:hypothetical protein
MANGTGAPFLVGNVLTRGFSILFRHLFAFSVISLIVFVPYIVLVVLTLPRMLRHEDPWLSFTLNLLQLILTYLVTAAIAYGTYQDIKGGRWTIADCLNQGLARLFPVLGVAILSAIAILIGLVALVVPGFILLTILWVAVPVAVVERPGVFASLSRSAELTQSNRWRVFGIIMILIAINLGAGFLIGLISVMVALIAGGSGGVQGAVSSALPIIAALSIIATVLTTAMNAVMTAVGYHDLRVAKEGIGVDDIVRVFD